MYTQQLCERIDQDLFWNPTLVEERIAFFQLLKTIGKLYPIKTCRRGLDIGTLTGFYPRVFNMLNIESYAINIAAEPLKYARDSSNYELIGSKVIQADARRLPFNDNSFDLVSMMGGTFSHLQRGTHQQALDEITRILTFGGIVLLSDWNLQVAKQDFCGWYTPKQQEELRDNHYGFPKVCQSLKQKEVEIVQAVLLAENRLYMIAARKKD